MKNKNGAEYIKKLLEYGIALDNKDQPKNAQEIFESLNSNEVTSLGKFIIKGIHQARYRTLAKGEEADELFLNKQALKIKEHYFLLKLAKEHSNGQEFRSKYAKFRELEFVDKSFEDIKSDLKHRLDTRFASCLGSVSNSPVK